MVTMCSRTRRRREGGMTVREAGKWRKPIDAEASEDGRGHFFWESSPGWAEIQCVCSDAGMRLDLDDHGRPALCDACGKEYRLTIRLHVRKAAQL